ncbi:protein NO VEIN domain-containing protein [Janibacter indicus]|uniref:Protein NO VEIN C-terminal domain-containing protein n=1 Tax=Janibacter indicus TaxID=857417 RepID=A0A1W1YT43_9MICO|nr:DUF3883 domain-containing protein [Janibacter indicus]SMC38971.1 protein of unknown function [Janibacter indicus]
MAINFKLLPRGEVPIYANDSLGRTWAGWDDNVTLQGTWHVNRGQWNVSAERLARENYATMSFEGTVRLVARLDGFTTDEDGLKILHGQVLPATHPVSKELMGRTVPSGRNPVSYFDTSELEVTEPEPGNAVLLTMNPALYDFYALEAREAQAAISLGQPAPGRWSVAKRVQGIGPGDTVYMLKQGEEPRGIVASGTVTSEIFVDDHWDPEVPGELSYVEVSWTAVVDEDAPLPLESLKEVFPQQHWTPQSSGQGVRPEVVSGLAAMWAEFVGRAVDNGVAPSPAGGRGQGRVVDARLRKQIEDAAQDRLMRYYRDLGWDVRDVRYTEPYDALATKGETTRYLEAKGTMGSADTVIVTRNEVAHARSHPDACILGILTFLQLDENGDIDPESGDFFIGPFDPDAGELTPISYDFAPAWDNFTPL